jgi:aspartokinase-like uncharacterized kinase
MSLLPLRGGGGRARPLVIKIGGSLAETGRLKACLAAVFGLRRRVVVVPGGGPFADAVRERQKQEGLTDSEAHFLAIAAMHDMAAMLLLQQPGLVCAETLSDIGAAWRRGRIPVWLPLRLARRDDTIPRDWSVTSDGLAARLAERLGRLPVVLIKSVRVPRSEPARSLAARGVVDPTFAAIVRRSGLCWAIAGPHIEHSCCSRGRALG